MQILSKSLRLAVKTYQFLTASKMHTCRFFPSCSHYALDAIKYYAFPKALWLIICRLLSCHPWSKKPVVDILLQRNTK